MVKRKPNPFRPVKDVATPTARTDYDEDEPPNLRGEQTIMTRIVNAGIKGVMKAVRKKRRRKKTFERPAGYNERDPF